MKRPLVLVFLGIGVLLGFFFGLPPAFVFETGFLTFDVSKDISDARIFLLISSFWGYITIVIVLGVMLKTVITYPQRKRAAEEKLKSRYFPLPESRMKLEDLKKETGMIEEEIEKLFKENKQDFSYEDYKKALQCAIDLGIKKRDRAGDLLRM